MNRKKQPIIVVSSLLILLSVPFFLWATLPGVTRQETIQINLRDRIASEYGADSPAAASLLKDLPSDSLILDLRIPVRIKIGQKASLKVDYSLAAFEQKDSVVPEWQLSGKVNANGLNIYPPGHVIHDLSAGMGLYWRLEYIQEVQSMDTVWIYLDRSGDQIEPLPLLGFPFSTRPEYLFGQLDVSQALWLGGLLILAGIFGLGLNWQLNQKITLDRKSTHVSPL